MMLDDVGYIWIRTGESILSNKKLLETSASLLVTGALLVVTRS